MKDVTNLAEWVDPSKSALIVIDMQNDFCHSEGAFAKLGTDMGPIQEMMPRLRNLMDDAREAGCQVVIFRVARSPHDDWPAKRRLDELLFGADAIPIVEEGSWGAELCEGFEPKEGDILLTKNRYGGFTATNLDLILRNLNVDTIIMTAWPRTCVSRAPRGRASCWITTLFWSRTAARRRPRNFTKAP